MQLGLLSTVSSSCWPQVFVHSAAQVGVRLHTNRAKRASLCCVACACQGMIP